MTIPIIILLLVHVAKGGTESHCTDQCEHPISKDAFDLQGHLDKFQVSNTVWEILQTENICIGDLINLVFTFLLVLHVLAVVLLKFMYDV